MNELPAGSPSPLLRAWQALAAWPPEAVRNIWTLLGPLVRDPRNPDSPQLLKGFCQPHKLARGEVGQILSLLHNLLLKAAASDAAPAELQRNLAALGGGEGGERAAAVLLAGYEQAKVLLRQRLLRVALADHGKVLNGISWRMDSINDSDAARQLASSVLILTLNWQEGTTQGRTTVQLTPDFVRELRSVMQKFTV